MCVDIHSALLFWLALMMAREFKSISMMLKFCKVMIVLDLIQGKEEKGGHSCMSVGNGLIPIRILGN